MAWTVRGSNFDVGETFRTRPDWSWGPTNLLYNRNRVSFPGVKRPGRDLSQIPAFKAEVKGRVELYLSLSLGLFIACLRVNLPFYLLQNPLDPQTNRTLHFYRPFLFITFPVLHKLLAFTQSGNRHVRTNFTWLFFPSDLNKN